MNKIFYPVAAVLVLAGSAFTFFAPQNWKIADGYSIAWSVVGSEAGGIFKTFTGSLAFDEQNPAAGVFNVKVDVGSVNTGNGLMNKHAKSDEWLDAARFPVIQFTSRSISKTAGGYQVTGDLDLHGVKKSITIPFTFQKTAQGGTFAGTFTISRTEYHIGKPGGDVGDQIKLDISVPVIKS